jgi:hypothetical protein
VSFYEDLKFSIKKKPKFSIFLNLKIINNLTIILFNKLYFFWNYFNKKSGVIDYDSFFYPLDKINNWHKFMEIMVLFNINLLYQRF